MKYTGVPTVDTFSRLSLIDWILVCFHALKSLNLNFACFSVNRLKDQNTICLSVTFLRFLPEVSTGTDMPGYCCRTTLKEHAWLTFSHACILQY